MRARQWRYRFVEASFAKRRSAPALIFDAVAADDVEPYRRRFALG